MHHPLLDTSLALEFTLVLISLGTMMFAQVVTLSVALNGARIAAFLIAVATQHVLCWRVVDERKVGRERVHRSLQRGLHKT